MQKKDPFEKPLLYLVILEFAISVAALSVGRFTGNRYFDGVGVGLIIAWVTGAIAYGITKRGKSYWQRHEA